MAPRKKKTENPTDKSSNTSSQPPNVTIIVAIIGLLGTLGVAFFNYMSTRSQVVMPIAATQTAEARSFITATSANNDLLEFIDLNKPIKKNGEIIHHLDGGFQTVAAGVSVSDFMVKVDFVVPYSDHPWNNAITFRNGYRVWINNTIDRNGEGGYSFHDENDQWSGNTFQLPDGLLNIQEGNVNTIQFIADGNIGCFYINGENIADINLENSDAPSDVKIGISEPEYKIENAVTKYQNFSVYSLNGAITSCPLP